MYLVAIEVAVKGKVLINAVPSASDVSAGNVHSVLYNVNAAKCFSSVGGNKGSRAVLLAIGTCADEYLIAKADHIKVVYTPVIRHSVVDECSFVGVEFKIVENCIV